ncbi:MAG: signal recognition particle-docking protein FtsY [Candidatus Woesearchaeota archaeon]|nr:signal recognition particle-docking protein FtsY [Candidatus Woesearchaeota archaeon]
MFGFLKDKLKQAVKKFTKSAEEETQQEEVKQKKKEPKKKAAKKEAKKPEKAPKKKTAKTPKEKPKKKTPKKETKPDILKEKKATKKKKPKETTPEKEVDEIPEVPAVEQTEDIEAEVLPTVETTAISKEPEAVVPEKTAEEPAKEEIEENVKEAPPQEPKEEVTEETPEQVAEESEDTPAEESKEEVREKPKEDIPAVEEVVEEVDELVETPKEDVEETPEEELEQEKPKEKKGFFSKLFRKKEEPVAEEPEEKVERPEKEPTEEALPETTKEVEPEEATEEQEEPVVEELPEEQEEPEEEGFFGKLKAAVTKKTLSTEKFDEIFWELEIAMLENNVAVEVIEKIKTDLRDELTTGKVSRFSIEETISNRLRQSVEELFDVETFDLLKKVKENKPCKICVIGVNGSGKTTSLAKLVHLFQQNDLSCVVAASDTFRAAAIDQLEEHTKKLGVKLISQGYNADPAAVAFDAVKHAEAQDIDVVLIDTAGRLHSNTNLMAELEKVVRVSKPDLKIFVGESITGNDCVEQAKVFNSLVGIDALILSKADIDEKGGAAISVSYVTGKPILYLGTGQSYSDLEKFDKEKIISALEL